MVPEVIELGDVFLGEVVTRQISINTSKPEKVTISSHLIKIVFFDNEKQQATASAPCSSFNVCFRPDKLGP